MSPEQLSLIAIMSVLAMAGFFLGFAGSGLKLRLEESEERDDSRAYLGVAALFLGSIGVAALFFGPILIEVSSYESNYRILNTSPIFAFTSKMFVLSGGILAAYFLRLRTVWVLPIAIIFLVACWGIYSSNKDPILIAILASASLFHINKLGKSLSALVAIVSGVVVISAVFPVLFSMYRAGLDLSTALVVVSHRGVFMSSDPSGPFVSLLGAVTSTSDMLWGSTYIQAITSWVPGFLWPGKPVSLAEEFAIRNIADWSPGRGLGFSLLGESYMNFGLIGPLVQFAGIGWLWGMSWRVVRTTRLLDTRLFKSVYSVAGLYMIFIMHRGESSLIVTQFVQSILPILVVALVASKIKYK